MKSKLVLCSMVLACSIALMAQQSSAPSSTSNTSPPTIPLDQSQQLSTGSRLGHMGSQPGQLGSNSIATQDQVSPSSSQMEQRRPSSNSGERQRVEGCLGGTDGNFTLTDKAGMTYKLQGENPELAKHMGQEVWIMGTESSADPATSNSSTTDSDAPSNPSSANLGNATNLTVLRVKKISDSCSANPGAGNTVKK